MFPLSIYSLRMRPVVSWSANILKRQLLNPLFFVLIFNLCHISRGFIKSIFSHTFSFSVSRRSKKRNRGNFPEGDRQLTASLVSSARRLTITSSITSATAHTFCTFRTRLRLSNLPESSNMVWKSVPSSLLLPSASR